MQRALTCVLWTAVLATTARSQGFGPDVFEAPLPAGTFGHASTLAAGDLDENGLTDLVARDLFPGSGSVHVLHALGGGAFVESLVSIAQPGKAGFTPLDVAQGKGGGRGGRGGGVVRESTAALLKQLMEQSGKTSAP